MSWPSTPLTSYVATVTPYIKAADLNAFQNAINGICSVTTIGGVPDSMYSLAGVWLDGTGGQIITPVLGSLRASKAVNSTTYPTPSSVVIGEYPRDGAPAALASISAGFVPPVGVAGGGLLAGFGIHDLLHNGPAGDVTITFRRVPTANNKDSSVVEVTPSAGATASVTKSLDGSNRLVVRVVLTPALDIPFDVVAWIF